MSYWKWVTCSKNVLPEKIKIKVNPVTISLRGPLSDQFNFHSLKSCFWTGLYFLLWETSSSERNLRLHRFQSDWFPRPPPCVGFLSRCSSVSVCLFVSFLLFYPTHSPFITGHAGWWESCGWGELIILRVPGSRTLFEPRAARDQVPQETPGVLRSDGGREMFPHVQRK